MSVATYTINPFDGLVTNGWNTDLLLHDLPDDTEELHAYALAASGDYFEMLASALDQIARTLPVHSAEQYQLQSYISQLLYLQRRYRIVKK